MEGVVVITAVTALAGIVMVVLALSKLRRGHLITSGGNGLIGLTLLIIGGTLTALGLNLHTYQSLTGERDVAELSFQQLAPQYFRLSLKYPDSDRVQVYTLQGDEWQLDARILKWRGLASLVGLSTQYRIERLSGRYHDIAQEQSQPRSVHALVSDAGLDVWAFARRHKRWLPWVDAVYGSAAYLPMANDARYKVRVTQSGLVARPMNTAGIKALENWL